MAAGRRMTVGMEEGDGISVNGISGTVEGIAHAITVFLEYAVEKRGSCSGPRRALLESTDDGRELPASQSVLGRSLVTSGLRLSSRTCSKVFPNSSFARLTSLPASSTYSVSTGRSATEATTSSSTTSPLSS